MKSQAIEKARRRLRVASGALDQLRSAASSDEFDDAWFVFLTSWKGIYTVLELGAMDSAQSRRWFGEKKTELKRTNYLQYLFVARNDEEHGLGQAIGFGNAGSIRLIPGANAKPGEPMHFSWHEDPLGVSGRMEVIREVSGKLLGPVKNRDGTEIQPPWVYIGGSPLFTPIEIASLGRDYAATMIDQAAALVKT
jgi:hypothetical protein